MAGDTNYTLKNNALRTDGKIVAYIRKKGEKWEAIRTSDNEKLGEFDRRHDAIQLALKTYRGAQQTATEKSGAERLNDFIEAKEAKRDNEIVYQRRNRDGRLARVIIAKPRGKELDTAIRRAEVDLDRASQKVEDEIKADGDYGSPRSQEERWNAVQRLNALKEARGDSDKSTITLHKAAKPMPTKQLKLDLSSRADKRGRGSAVKS